MKSNTFTEKYEKIKSCEAEYEAAESDADRDTAQRKAEEVYAEIAAKGKTYWNIYTLCAEAQERGNEYIDLDKCFWYEDVEELINAFREYRIDRFTYSATSGNIAENAWQFLDNGFTLEGMVKLHGSVKLPYRNEFETIPGFLFKVN